MRDSETDKVRCRVRRIVKSCRIDEGIREGDPLREGVESHNVMRSSLPDTIPRRPVPPAPSCPSCDADCRRCRLYVWAYTAEVAGGWRMAAGNWRADLFAMMTLSFAGTITLGKLKFASTWHQ